MNLNFYLIDPFIVNLYSALFILFNDIRLQSAVRTEQTYRELVREQLHEHNHPMESSVIVFILAKILSFQFAIHRLRQCIVFIRNDTIEFLLV